MAKIFDLCGSVPAELVRVQQANVVRERMAESIEKRWARLDGEQGFFEACKGRRQQKRVRQRVTKCGNGTRVVDVRAGEYITVVCRRAK